MAFDLISGDDFLKTHLPSFEFEDFNFPSNIQNFWPQSSNYWKRLVPKVKAFFPLKLQDPYLLCATFSVVPIIYSFLLSLLSPRGFFLSFPIFLSFSQKEINLIVASRENIPIVKRQLRAGLLSENITNLRKQITPMIGKSVSITSKLLDFFKSSREDEVKCLKIIIKVIDLFVSK